MKKIYNLLLVSSVMLSTCAFGQSDKQLTTTTITAAQQQAILANVKNAPVSNLKAVAACDTLAVQNIAGNGYNGNMFDISATTNVMLETFSVSVDAGTWNIAIYYKSGTFVGSESSSTGWIFLDSAQVTSTTTGAGAFYKVPVDVNLQLLAGSTYGFYVTGTDGTITMNYTNGVGVGTMFSSDANLTVYEGNGGAWPFSVLNSPRVFNGKVFYCPGTAGIEENNLSSVDVYPNPANESVSVDLTAFNGNNVTVTIVNTLGQVLQSSAIMANGVSTLNLEGYASGLYFVQLEMNGKTSSSKLSIK